VYEIESGRAAGGLFRGIMWCLSRNAVKRTLVGEKLTAAVTGQKAKTPAMLTSMLLGC
jgi:hypothetical protein